MGPRVIYWFRTDLRLHDSPALQAALDLKPDCLYPIWTWDPHYVYRARVGPNRFQFLLDCQNDLSKAIKKLNKKSQLLVIREAPQTLFPKLLKAWKISHLVFEKDVDAYARHRDEEVVKLAEEAGVQVIMRSGRTLWDSDKLVEANGGKPTMSMTQVLKASSKIGNPARPIPPPKSLPDPGDTALDFDQERPPSSPDLNAGQRQKSDQSYAKLAGPKGDFAVPTMAELGLENATTPHRGGETNALKALDKIIANEKYAATFEKPKTAPTDFNPQSTTLLSPHMHFGSLSCREFYWRAEDACKAYKSRGKPSTPPESLTGQIIFRDMYFGAQAGLGAVFSQTRGNAQAHVIPWHLPSKVDDETGLITGEYEVDDEQAQEWFLRWKYGRTGFPWIDAIMRQLRQEGWIHHLARHAVACFLTRGGCYIDWERGAEVFEEWLIDHEVACNAGNWQWLSCTAFFTQYHRIYSPIAFPRKWDASGAYVRYVPELASYSDKYIYEPWRAPIADQKKWACVVRGDGGGADEAKLRAEVEEGVYPAPMLDFAAQREKCLAGMGEAYRVKLMGDDERVKDGSWRGLFKGGDEGGKKKSSGKHAREGSKGQGTMDAHVKRSKR